MIVDLLGFFAERLKVLLREQGARHDLVDAVFALEGQDDLLVIVRRVEALAKLLDTDDGKNLLAGYRRATNIIRIEEKRDNYRYSGEPNPEIYRHAEEWALASAIDMAQRVYLEGIGLGRLWPDLWPLAIIAVLTLSLASWMFRHRLV